MLTGDNRTTADAVACAAGEIEDVRAYLKPKIRSELSTAKVGPSDTHTAVSARMPFANAASSCASCGSRLSAASAAASFKALTIARTCCGSMPSE
jgi:magnesium-transporting ATPase (P-type)